MVLARSHPTKATQPSLKGFVPSVPLREFRIRGVQLMGPKCCRDSRFPTEYPVSFFLSLQKPSVDCWGVAMAQLWKWMFYSLADENGWGDRWRHFWLRFGGNSIKGDNLTQRNILFLVLYFLLLAWDKVVLAGVLRGFLDHEVNLRTKITSKVGWKEWEKSEPFLTMEPPADLGLPTQTHFCGRKWPTPHLLQHSGFLFYPVKSSC